MIGFLSSVMGLDGSWQEGHGHLPFIDLAAGRAHEGCWKRHGAVEDRLAGLQDSGNHLAIVV
jgi:hypothetical protein